MALRGSVDTTNNTIETGRRQWRQTGIYKDSTNTQVGRSREVTQYSYEWIGLTKSAATTFLATKAKGAGNLERYEMREVNRVLNEYVVTGLVDSYGPWTNDSSVEVP